MAKYSLKDTIKAIGAAALGVQSDKNRHRDFNEGKFSHFVIIGLLSVTVFVGILVLIARMVASYFTGL